MTNTEILTKATASIPDAFDIAWGYALPIPNLSDYWATAKGLIVSTKYRHARVLKPSVKENKRMTVNIWNRGVLRSEYVHRLVAMAFHGEPNSGEEVNHLDGDPTNNMPGNLEWCTRSHNQRHAFATGLNHGSAGESNANSTLNIQQVREIRSLRGQVTQAKLAAMYGVTKSAVKHIHMGRTWKNV